MRIAQIVPLHVAVPPAGYGGTERVVYNLTEALVSRGHEVTLFATGDSRTSAKLVPLAEKAICFDPAIEWAALHMAELEYVYNRAHQFDVIHSHLDYLTLPYISRTTTPTVLTLHGRLDQPEFRRVFNANLGANYVSISNSQRRDVPDINWVATVYHGIDVASFPYSPRRGKYLAFVGRMSPEKRCDMAIAIARRTGIPLKIAAKIDHKERPYFERVIRPLLDDPLVEFLGEQNEDEKRALLRDALALLLPIDWPEPFGMAFIEALACGTPVLTRPCGSVPELLQDGLTGYIAEDEDALAAAVGRLDRISRLACRHWAEQRFDRQRMAAGYERVYERARQRQKLRVREQERAPLFSLPRQPELTPGKLASEPPIAPVVAQ